MKWVLSQQSLDHHRWLLQDAQEQAQFTYHRQHHSIRIKAKTSRLFFLEVSGFFHKKVLLRTEYGVSIGEAQWSHAVKDGVLLLNEQKYFYCWEENRIILSDKSKSSIREVSLENADKLEKMEQFALLFTTSWITYIELNSKKEDLLVA